MVGQLLEMKTNLAAPFLIAFNVYLYPNVIFPDLTTNWSFWFTFS